MSTICPMLALFMVLAPARYSSPAPPQSWIPLQVTVTLVWLTETKPDGNVRYQTAEAYDDESSNVIPCRPHSKAGKADKIRRGIACAASQTVPSFSRLQRICFTASRAPAELSPSGRTKQVCCVRQSPAYLHCRLLAVFPSDSQYADSVLRNPSLRDHESGISLFFLASSFITGGVSTSGRSLSFPEDLPRPAPYRSPWLSFITSTGVSLSCA